MPQCRAYTLFGILTLQLRKEFVTPHISQGNLIKRPEKIGKVGI